MTAPALHEPTDHAEPTPVLVSRALYERLCMTLGASVEGPADDEVVWLNDVAYRAVSS